MIRFLLLLLLINSSCGFRKRTGFEHFKWDSIPRHPKSGYVYVSKTDTLWIYTDSTFTFSHRNKSTCISCPTDSSEDNADKSKERSGKFFVNSDTLILGFGGDSKGKVIKANYYKIKKHDLILIPEISTFVYRRQSKKLIFVESPFNRYLLFK